MSPFFTPGRFLLFIPPSFPEYAFRAVSPSFRPLQSLSSPLHFYHCILFISRSYCRTIHSALQLHYMIPTTVIPTFINLFLINAALVKYLRWFRLLENSNKIASLRVCSGRKRFLIRNYGTDHSI